MNAVTAPLRIWYATQAELDLVTNLPDGTPVGAQDTGLTFTFDAIRGLVPDVPAWSAGDALVARSGRPEFLGPPVVTAPGTSTLVSNTTTETDVFAFSVAGGRMGANGRFRLIAKANPQNTTGSPQTLTFTLYRTESGASEVAATTQAVTIQTMGAGNGQGLFELEIVNQNVESGDQFYVFSYREAFFTVGTPLVDRQQVVHAAEFTGTDWDSTLDVTFRLTATLGVASANYSLSFGPGWVESVYIP